MLNNELMEMSNKYIPQSTEEKALFYLHHISTMFYSFRGLLNFSLFGIIGLVMIIIERHFSFKYFLSVFIGAIVAFLDIKLRFLIAIKKPVIYERAFEWEKTAYPFRLLDIETSNQMSSRTKFFSLEGFRLGIKNLFTMTIYESYKWFLVLFLFIFSLFLAISGGSTGGAGFFTLSLTMVSWGAIYLILWKKKYFRLCAEKLGLTDEQFIAIRDYGKNSGA